MPEQTVNNNIPLNIDDLIERGTKIYYQIQNKENIEKTHRGQYIAIDVATEQYFIAESRDEAMQAGASKLPNVAFFVKRIGGIDTVSRQYPYFINKQVSHARFL
jgi:hypothetical protein